MKNIKKKCIIAEDTIIIKLEDPRDEYVYENALGEIGNIYISREGILIYPHFDSDDRIQTLRDEKLIKAFTEIFEATDYNPLSREYYYKIITMIKEGSLQSLGYIVKTAEEELTEPIEFDNLDFSDYDEDKTEDLFNFEGINHHKRH